MREKMSWTTALTPLGGFGSETVQNYDDNGHQPHEAIGAAQPYNQQDALPNCDVRSCSTRTLHNNTCAASRTS